MVRGLNSGESESHSIERFDARSCVAFGCPGADVAEEAPEREAVDAFAREVAGERVALVVEAEAARDAGERFSRF